LDNLIAERTEPLLTLIHPRAAAEPPGADGRELRKSAGDKHSRRPRAAMAAVFRCVYPKGKVQYEPPV
jgi:hypothetical protein